MEELGVGLGGPGPWPQVCAARAENARPKSKAEPDCAQRDWGGVLGGGGGLSLSASAAVPGAPKPVPPATSMQPRQVAAALAHSRYPMNGRYVMDDWGRGLGGNDTAPAPGTVIPPGSAVGWGDRE